MSDDLDTEELRRSYWTAWNNARVDPLFGWLEEWQREHPGHPGFDVDLEARTITPWPNHEPPAEPAPLDTGRWERDDEQNCWYIDTDPSVGESVILWHSWQGDSSAWRLNNDGRDPSIVSADDLEAAARIIRWHQERDHG